MELLDSVKKIILQSEETEVDTYISKIQENNSIVIFGAGSHGEYVANFLTLLEYKVSFFIDNDNGKWGQTIMGISVISPDELLKLNRSNLRVLICSTWHIEIEDQLTLLGINNFIVVNEVQLFGKYFLEELRNFEQINDLWFDLESQQTFEHLLAFRISDKSSNLKISQFAQYFHPEVSPKQGDVIIDGGAYIGDTVKLFNDYLNANCLIYSFEPSGNNFVKLQELISDERFTNVIPVQAGLGKEKNELFMNPFEDSISPGYSISFQGTEKIKIISIDEYVEENNLETVDLIKLDIEGFELDALKGSYETIRRFRPRLQVCLYHKPEDLIEIPFYIQKLSKELGYKKIYVGHHTDCFYETVLYATCK